MADPATFGRRLRALARAELIRAELRVDVEDWRAEDRLLAALVEAKAWTEVVEVAETAILRMEARRATTGTWDGERVCLIHRVAKGLAEGTSG